MAIAFDSFSGNAGTATSSSQNHTVTGAFPGMVVSVLTVDSASDTVTSITFNGISLTQVGSYLNIGPGSRAMSLWYLSSPATGTHSLAYTFSLTNQNFIVACATYTGVASVQPDASAASVNQSAGTTFTNVVTSVADNCWHVAGFSAANISAGASTTQRGRQQFFSTGIYLGIYDGNADVTPAGSDTLNFACANSARAATGITLAPNTATAVPASIGFFGLFDSRFKHG